MMPLSCVGPAGQIIMGILELVANAGFITRLCRKMALAFQYLIRSIYVKTRGYDYGERYRGRT